MTNKPEAHEFLGARIETTLESRPKSRTPAWRCVVRRGDELAFDSAWAAIRLLDRDGARYLGRLVASAFAHSVYIGPPGHAAAGSESGPVLSWTGDPNDDCTAQHGMYFAHAEHLDGPVAGGNWYCGITVPSEEPQVFHSVDQSLQPKNGGAARWLCELVIRVAELGALPLVYEAGGI